MISKNITTINDIPKAVVAATDVVKLATYHLQRNVNGSVGRYLSELTYHEDKDVITFVLRDSLCGVCQGSISLRDVVKKMIDDDVAIDLDYKGTAGNEFFDSVCSIIIELITVKSLMDSIPAE